MLIRPAERGDVSRIAEILIFAKRTAYRPIFRNDRVSFGEMQVLPLAQEYLNDPNRLRGVWVYEDEFVKGMLHMERHEVKELYVDPFFQGEGVGGQLLEHAVKRCGAEFLWVLEKNHRAIAFYQKRGFTPTGEREPEPGTEEDVVKLQKANKIKMENIFLRRGQAPA